MTRVHVIEILKSLSAIADFPVDCILGRTTP